MERQYLANNAIFHARSLVISILKILQKYAILCASTQYMQRVSACNMCIELVTLEGDACFFNWEIYLLCLPRGKDNVVSCVKWTSYMFKTCFYCKKAFLIDIPRIASAIVNSTCSWTRVLYCTGTLCRTSLLEFQNNSLDYSTFYFTALFSRFSGG